MKILVAGLPGSGKTSEVGKIAEGFNLEKVQMGDLLREIAQTGSELGNRVAEIMKSGDLVDDETVAEIIKEKVEKVGGDNFVMEGFPRTLKQVELYDPKFDKVFFLEVPNEVAIRRMKGRGRTDDSDQAIDMRLKVQMRDMEKILSHYTEVLVKVDGTKSIDEVFAEIKTYLS